MTPGEKLLLQQIHLVAHARGWDIPKTIKKTQLILGWLQAAVDMLPPSKGGSGKPKRQVSTPEEAKLIAQAEEILQDLQKKPPKDPPNPEPPEPPIPPLAAA